MWPASSAMHNRKRCRAGDLAELRRGEEQRFDNDARADDRKRPLQRPVRVYQQSGIRNGRE